MKKDTYSGDFKPKIRIVQYSKLTISSNGKVILKVEKSGKCKIVNRMFFGQMVVEYLWPFTLAALGA